MRSIPMVLVLLCVPALARAQQHDMRDMPMPDSADQHAAMAADAAMAGPMIEDLHMRLSPRRASSPRDSARAAERVRELREALARYRDVRTAEADGYQVFLPDLPQPVYHFTNWRYGVASAFAFDPAKPSSLLYRRTPAGEWELVGAMYTARAGISMDDLDARVPLSVARWHQHVNWCLPPRGARERWTELDHGRPRFGPKSPIATKEACDAVGGRFVPRLFGWMVHANVFGSDDPAEIWGSEHHH